MKKCCNKNVFALECELTCYFYLKNQKEPLVTALGQLRTDSLEKTLIGKIEGRRRSGWQRMRWLDGHEFEQALGDSEGQGRLECCSPWDRKESDTTERLNNWTTKDLRKTTAEFWQSHQGRRHHPEKTLVKTKDSQVLHRAWYSSAWSQQDTPANH